MIVLPHSNQLFARNGPEQTNGWKSCQKIDGSEELETRPLRGRGGKFFELFFLEILDSPKNIYLKITYISLFRYLFAFIVP